MGAGHVTITLSRRKVIAAFGGAAAAWPLVAHSQAGKIYRIGFLGNDPTIPAQQAYQAFLDGLREGGFVEGQNIIIERRFAEGRFDRYPVLVGELMRLNVDIIVTSGSDAIPVAKRATTQIPIVMVNVSDPVGQGIVASLAHPGGNITGVIQDDAAEIAPKRMQILKDAVPHAANVAILLDPASPYEQAQWQHLELAARSLNVSVQRIEYSQASGWEGVFAAIGRGHSDAMVVTNGAKSFISRRSIIEFANNNGLPLMSGYQEYTENGGLISYGSLRTDRFRRAAIFVGRILKGANPADLPVEQPTKYDLIVNLKTARLLNLAIPRSLLLIADEVIE
jgi:putative tryptophan/tyrosine transport system substrate-binding protein